MAWQVMKVISRRYVHPHMRKALAPHGHGHSGGAGDARINMQMEMDLAPLLNKSGKERAGDKYH